MKNRFRKVYGYDSTVLWLDRTQAVLWNIDDESEIKLNVKSDTDTRACLNEAKKRLCVGGWESGTQCYTLEGNLAWSSENITQYSGIVSFDRFYAFNNIVDCNVVPVFAADTGAHVKDIAFANHVCVGRRELFILQPDQRLSLEHRESGLRRPTEISSFGLLCCADGAKAALVGTASREIVLIDLTTGKRIFDLRTEVGAFNMQAASFCPAMGCFFALITEFDGRKAAALIKMEENGIWKTIKEIPSCRSADFVGDGRWLALSTGQVLASDSGEEWKRAMI